MKKHNLTLIDNYCPQKEDTDLRKRLIGWIKEAGALTIIDGKQYIDILKFDAAILKALDNERNQIQVSYDFSSAAIHIAKAFDIFNTRYAYLDRTREEYMEARDENVENMKLIFNTAAVNFGELTQRLVLAYESFFQAEPNKDELAKVKKTINVNQYYL